MPAVRICITSPQPNNDRLAQMLRDKGIDTWQLPLLKYVQPLDHYAALDRAISELSIYSIVVFTSAHAVGVFQERLERCNAVQLGHLKFAVVGESTAQRCAEHGFPVHYIPQEATSRALGELLRLQAPADSTILFPQAEEGREEFSQAMATASAKVTVVPAYCTVPAPVDVPAWQRRMTSEPWNGFVVTSPKGLRTWLNLFGHAWCHEILDGRHLFVMGRTTEESAQRLGFRNVHISSHATLESLSQTIADSFT